MLTKITAAVGILCLILPAATFAQGFSQGDKALTLTGSGSSDNEFVDNVFNVEANLAYFFTDNVEGAIRQSFARFDEEGNDWAASTRVALDYDFDVGNWGPFIGVSFGYRYGEATSDTWVAGPEAGVRYFVNDTTYILGLIEYQFFFDESDNADDAFDDGAFIYTLGIGFRWQ